MKNILKSEFINLELIILSWHKLANFSYSLFSIVVPFVPVKSTEEDSIFETKIKFSISS
jgi:hypothetical protein